MARIGKKAVDLSEFDYEQPVIFRELTLGDVNKIYALGVAERKKWENGEVPDTAMNSIILEKIIESAPFDKTREGLDNLPISLIIFLLEQAKEMLAPLLPPDSKDSKSTTGEEKSQTTNQQNSSTDSNS